jgi:hypothetical protein
MTNITKHMLSFLYFAIAVLFFAITIKFKDNYQIKKVIISKEKSSINISSKLYKISSMGQSRLISKIIWIKTLLNSDIQRYSGESFGSWMYYRFQNISILDPYFIYNYMFGSLYLSVVKDDIKGASDMYDIGSKFYPKNFYINYYGGIHFLMEVGDYKKAAEFLTRIKDHKKSPDYLDSIIARIHAGKNDLKLSYELLVEAIKGSNISEFMKKKYEVSLYAIKAEIDLSCINNQKLNCDKYDYEGFPYEQKGSVYKAIKEWKRFRVFKTKRMKNNK